MIGQVLAASGDDLGGKVDALGHEVLRGPLGEEGVGEPAHDLDVVLGLGSAQIAIELQPLRVGHPSDCTQTVCRSRGPPPSRENATSRGRFQHTTERRRHRAW